MQQGLRPYRLQQKALWEEGATLKPLPIFHIGYIIMSRLIYLFIILINEVHCQRV